MRPRSASRFHHELMFKYLPGSAFSRVKQHWIAEERREHSLNPAGLSRAVVLIFCLLALRPTWASHSTSKGTVTCLLTSNKLTLIESFVCENAELMQTFAKRHGMVTRAASHLYVARRHYPECLLRLCAAVWSALWETKTGSVSGIWFKTTLRLYQVNSLSLTDY